MVLVDNVNDQGGSQEASDAKKPMVGAEQLPRPPLTKPVDGRISQSHGVLRSVMRLYQYVGETRGNAVAKGCRALNSPTQ